MVREIREWGVKPRRVTGDSWYSRVENLKFIINQRLGFLFGIEKNIIVSNEPQKYCKVSTLEMADEGLVTHLKEVGFIKLLSKDFKKADSRHYILYLPEREKLKETTRSKFITIYDFHWGFETFHRALKQECGICRFMVRNTQASETHIFCSLHAFIKWELMRSKKIISNWYEVQRNLFTLVVREHILASLSSDVIVENT